MTSLSPPPMRAFCWFLLLLPWVYLPGVSDAFLWPKEMVWQIGVPLLLGLDLLGGGSLLMGYRNPWLGRFLAWVLCWAGVQFWWPLLTHRPDAGAFSTNPAPWMLSLNILLGVLLLWWLVTHHLLRYQACVRLTQTLCWSGAIVATYALLQFFRYDPLFDSTVRTVLYFGHPYYSYQFMLGAMGNPGYVAMYLALILPLCLVMAHPKYLVMFGLMATVLVLIEARYAQASALAGVLTYGWLRVRERFHLWATLAYLLTIGTGLSLAIPRLLSDERWPIWWETALRWKRQFLNGYGLGSFKTAFYDQWTQLQGLSPNLLKFPTPWAWTHNDALQLGYELGAIGVVLLLLALWRPILSMREKLTALQPSVRILMAGWAGAGASLLCLSLTNFPWHLVPCAAVGLCIVAMWAAPDPKGVVT